MYRLVDTHSHLEQIDNLDGALDTARLAGVTVIIAVGTDLESNREVLELGERYRGFVYPALGLHPWFIKEAEVERSLEFMASHIDEAVAIGEIGLDYHKRVKERADKELQKNVLDSILNLAKAHRKPALVHSRYAWRDALSAVEKAGIEKAVFHWYTGTSSVLRDIIADGYYISVTPAVEYHEEHRRAVKEVPLEKMLLETDSPVIYHRGSEHEYESSPADVVRSLEGAAGLKNLDKEKIAALTTGNALDLFGLSE